MAKKSSSVTYSKPDVATKSAFEGLPIDDTGDTSSEDDAPAPAVTSPAATPSKKALARKRAALRKKGSRVDLSPSGGNSGNATGTESEAGPTVNSIPPVPRLPSVQRAAEQANGNVQQATETVKKQASAATETIKQQLPASFKVDTNKAKKAADAATARATGTASSSDAETVSDYGDEDDSDLDESSAPAPAAADARAPKTPSPRANSPPPKSPTTTATQSTAGAYTGADHDPNKKLKAIVTRTVWGLTMATGAISLVAMGHIYVIILVFVCQAVVFSELTNLFDVGYSGHLANGEEADAPILSQKDMEREKRRQDRRAERTKWSRRMSWYFFAVTNYFLYGESLIYYFKHILTQQAGFLPAAFSFAQQHRLISFGLYILGFVWFVATLNRSQLRRQFGLFGWVHMSLLLIVVSSHFIVNNILEGMIWFWVPVSVVIINDIAAYVCGMMFGRHQLIKLSPKKTVEGFVGAFFITILFAILWGTFFMRFNYMICPAQDLSTNAFSNITCTPNQTFVWRHLPLPSEITMIVKNLTGRTFLSIPWAPFQLHSIVLAVFASLVAPFGGFFASGFKRAFNIKDFGDSIPGHGGMTDRMDCQFAQATFTYVYYTSLIRPSSVPASIINTIAQLSQEQQLEIFEEIKSLLKMH